MRVMWFAAVLCACGGSSNKRPEAPKPDADLKAWDEATAGFTRADGLFPTWTRADGGLLLEIPASLIDRDLGLASMIGRGPSFGYAVEGAMIDQGRLIQLRRVGRKIYTIQKNHQVIPPAHDGTPGRPVGESVIGTMSVIAVRGTTALVDPSEWFVADTVGAAELLRPVYTAPDTTMSFDRAHSLLERIKTFPHNVEIDATLTFTPGKLPKVVLPSPANPSIVSLTIHQSIYALPETPAAIREADDRIGYFHTPVQDAGEATAGTLERARDRLHRWRLEKRDPSAAKSPPKTPITMYLDPSIPVKWRRIVREGLLEWNKAFEPLGITNAIEVVDAPPGFDYQDTRFASVHWSTSIDVPFWAYGPETIDPRTGEILSSDILIMSDMLSGQAWASAYPTRGCAMGMAAAQQVNVIRALAGARPGVDVEAIMPDILRETVMHEMGHVLGLRHNFRASSEIPFDKLHDKQWTAVHGLTTSVMDYMPINVAPPGTMQGHYVSPTIGEFDKLAIRYGYLPDADRPMLGKIAAEAMKPGLQDGWDDDNWLGDWAVDPFTSGFDLGSDPLAFGTRQSALLDEILPTAAAAVVKEGESWTGARDAVLSLLGYRTFVLRNALKLVGGLDVRRVHRGDPGTPLTPIAPDLQRKALALVIERGLGDAPARLLTPDVLAMLAPRRSKVMIDATVVPVDPPIHAVLFSQQAALIGSIFHPARLNRILDNTVRTAGKDKLAMSELFDAVTKAVFGDLETAKTIDSYRRNLQRALATRYLALVREPDGGAHGGPITDTGGPPPTLVPADARALARAQLKVIAKRAAAAAPKATTAETAAHLAELAELITKTLDAPPLPASPPPAVPEFLLFP